eukprot:2737781-Lingulodinium_polyedra.AAC.1
MAYIGEQTEELEVEIISSRVARSSTPSGAARSARRPCWRRWASSTRWRCATSVGPIRRWRS